MRLIITYFALFFCGTIFSQIDYESLEIEYGDYDVGYKNIELIDSSRSYSRGIDFGRKVFRPISISVWEPCATNLPVKKITIKDYLCIHQHEEEWPNLPFEYFFDWFAIRSTDHNKSQVGVNTKAVSNYSPRMTDKPVIIYSSSFRAPSVENFILCEYLSSYGYKVLSIPSKGYENISFEGGTIKDATAQSLDLEFVIENLEHILQNSSNKIYLMGFSFGGLSHIINACNDKRIRGVVSLDGTIKYKPELLDSSPSYELGNFSVPFVHISQKDIPDSLLQKENTSVEINTNFQFYDEIDVPSKYQIKSRNLSHTFFSSYGILFNERNPRQDPGYNQIEKSYVKLLKLVKFSISSLNSQTFANTSSIDSLNVFFEEFDMIKSDKKIPVSSRFVDNIGLEDFQSVELMNAMYEMLRNINPNVSINEGDLNVLGLHLIFQEDTFEEGVTVFKFALEKFPNSSNLHDSLAEGYRYHEKIELAKFHFQKSLELNPDNSNAYKRLQEMKN